MASDGPGKFKEKKNRSSKPYERPKGIIRRVTDSVTGLFSSSWLSGWMAGEEDDDTGDPKQPGTSQISTQSRVSPQVNTLSPPGESFIFAQPVTSRRSFRPIYPEEGEIEGNSQHAHDINVGATTSSGVRMNLATATSVAIPTATSAQLSTETPSPLLTGRRHPIISSTPTQMFASPRTKSQLEPRPLPLLTTATPTGDDGSEFSESSADTGVDASVIPRPDERDYQREILQLDDESLQTLRESLAKSVPAAPANQPTSALPSLEETRKRPRDAEPDQTGTRAEGSFSNKSLFSEVEMTLGQPQPSALASKRPRFNVSTYGSPVMFDRSVLSDSSFKMSPFYPGKTMYGGASSYRRGRLQRQAQTARVQVRPKPAQTSADAGLSQAARRILDCLEQMSTPISDAKRIPTPIPGQRGSFLDATSSYTAAYHRHRPLSGRQTGGPPTSKPSTPVKVSVQENISTSLLVSTTSGTSSSGTTTCTTSSNTNLRLGESSTSSEVSTSKEGKGGTLADTREDFSSSFSKAVAEATAKFKTSPPPVISSVTTTPSSMFTFVSSNKNSVPPFEFAPKPAAVAAAAALSSGSKKAGGKVKSKVVASGRTSGKREEDEDDVEYPKLPSVSLTMSSLPKITFTTSENTSPAKVSSSEGFKFASPEVVHGNKVPSEVATSAPEFIFSSPAAVGRGNHNNLDSTPLPTIPLLFNSCSPGSTPKLKEVVKKDKSPIVRELKEGSILDILKPKRKSPIKMPRENNSATSPVFNSIDGKMPMVDTSIIKMNENIPKVGSEQTVGTINSVSKKTETSQVFQGFSSFMKSSNEWECSVCMLRNKNTVEKCVACEASKPGLNSSSSKTGSLYINAAEDPPASLTSSIGWGDAFKKSANEWECEMCLVRNKDSSEKCVACETPRPGGGSNSSNKSDSSSLSRDSKVLDSKEEKTNIGFGLMFAKAKGEWECATCLVRNKSDATKCISCETPKPGAVAVSQAITGNFKFGVNTNDSSTSSSFKFGVCDSHSEVKSSGGFKFGIGAKNTEESSSKGISEFKFGVSEQVKSTALTGGVSCDVASVKSKEKSECVSSSSFSFGVEQSSDKAKEMPSKVPNFSFSSPKSDESKSESANTMTGFNFKAGSQDVPFNFGAGLKRKPERKDTNGQSEVNTASELKSGSVADVLKDKDGQAGTFSFGCQKDKTKESAAKSPSIFNNTLHTDDGKSKIPTSFGAPKVNESGTSAFVFGSKTAEATSSSSLVFGSKTAETTSSSSLVFAPKTAETTTAKLVFAPKTVETTTSSNSFTFGSEATKSASAPPPFSFTPPVNKEESKSVAVPTFSFGSKRESSDTGEPPKKMTFGSSSSSTVTHSNSVNAKSSPFTFGSKENNLSTGSSTGPGFGPPPTSTPAFGAPAPASNATPNFQFGHSTPPAPAATAPSPAFGSAAPAPAFSSSTAAFGTNNNASFAFGQATKKNTRAGFDFGQAAGNAASQGFNFAAGGAATPVFQFGQKQNDASSTLFQFGSSSTGFEVPAPAFGGDNPFNTPAAPPSGRVVKKARRRKQ